MADTVQVTKIILTPLIDRIGVEAYYTDDDTKVATLKCQFRVRAGPGAWRSHVSLIGSASEGHLWRHAPVATLSTGGAGASGDGLTRAFSGLMFDLVHSTTYDFEFTLASSFAASYASPLPVFVRGGYVETSVGNASVAGLVATITGTQDAGGLIVTRDDSSSAFHNVTPGTGILVPTHYVRADGSDANVGTADTAGGAWRTIKKAVQSAIVGGGAGLAVVQVGPGAFAGASGAVRSITQGDLALFGQNRGYDFNATTMRLERNAVAYADLTRIYGVRDTAGTLAEIAPGATWVQVTKGSPSSGTVWRCDATITGITRPRLIVYAAGLDSEAADWKRLNVWENETGITPQLTNVDEWAHYLYRADTWRGDYRYGGYYNTADSKLYLRMPPDATDDPSQYAWRLGEASVAGGFGNAFEFNGGSTLGSEIDVRLSNLVCIGVTTFAQNTGRVRFHMDHCDTPDVRDGVAFDATSGYVGVNPIVQKNRSVATSLAADMPTRLVPTPGLGETHVCPWQWVKQGGTASGGASDMGKSQETAFVRFAGTVSGWPRGLTMRENEIIAHFNGTGSSGPTSANLTTDANGDRYRGSWSQYRKNFLKWIADDCFDADGVVIGNLWIDNIATKVNNYLSTVALLWGPHYSIRDRVQPQLGHMAATYSATGGSTTFRKPGNTAYMFKIGAGFHAFEVPAILYVVNGSLHSTWVEATNAAHSVLLTSSPNGGSSIEGRLLRWWLANNLVRITAGSGNSEMSQWNYNTLEIAYEDYNDFSSSGANAKLRLAGVSYTTPIGAWRDTLLHGLQSNKRGGVDFTFQQVPSVVQWADVSGENPQTVLALAETSDFRLTGVRIGNVTDLPGVNFDGAEPDRGAMQFFEEAPPPDPPTPGGWFARTRQTPRTIQPRTVQPRTLVLR